MFFGLMTGSSLDGYVANQTDVSFNDTITNLVVTMKVVTTFASVFYCTSTTVSVESPKGAFGLSLFTLGWYKPNRSRIRSPCLVNLVAVLFPSEQTMIPDLVAMIGSVDVVLGSIDR